MGRYVLRRLVLALPVLLGVSVAVFLMIELVPGDPATVLAGDTASADQVERIRHELGLDQPLPVQYLRFVERLAHGSLGESTRTHREVLLEIAERFPYTLALALGAVTLSTVVGVGLGILAAINRGRAGDHVTMGIAIVGLSVPTFLLAIVGIIVFSLALHWLPVTGARTWQSYILPIVALKNPRIDRDLAYVTQGSG